jgi:nicotinate-nucleotide pyrophosphorylase (carboxylating)
MVNEYSERLTLAQVSLPEELQHPSVLQLLELSLVEDLSPSGLEPPSADHDLTSAATIPGEIFLKGRIFAKKPGTIAGLHLAAVVFTTLDPEVKFERLRSDGERVKGGDRLAIVEGSGIALLAGERTALNFLGRLSGIATLTSRYVDAVAHTDAVILDTRKTAPGYRLLDKYAVRMGGGRNHRMGLYDMVLIKNNHIDAAGGVESAYKKVREAYGSAYQIEVEVRTLDELETALVLEPSRILLDNMDTSTIRLAVETAAGKVPLEASGNVNLGTIREIAETGVEFISAGSLTHSAPVLDISMHLEK